MPETSPLQTDAAPTSGPSSLRAALLAWEKGRLPFNLVLLGFGLVWSWPLQATMKEEAWFGYWAAFSPMG